MDLPVCDTMTKKGKSIFLQKKAKIINFRIYFLQRCTCPALPLLAKELDIE